MLVLLIEARLCCYLRDVKDKKDLLPTFLTLAYPISRQLQASYHFVTLRNQDL